MIKMTNESEFKLALQKSNPSTQHKVDCCQYFIDNYPVTIKTFQGDLFAQIKDVKISPPHNVKLVDYAFNKLKDRFL